MAHEVIGHVRIAGQPPVHIRRCTTIAALERYLKRHGREDALSAVVGHFVTGIHLVIVQ